MLLALTDRRAVIQLESRHLKITVPGEDDTLTVPMRLLDRVIVSDFPRISNSLLQGLLERKIPMMFLSRRGEYLGGFYPAGSDDIERKKRQYLSLQNKDIAPVVALLEAKIYNQKRVLQKRSAPGKDVSAECRKISSLMKSLKRSADRDILRGVEGRVAALYFRALGRIVPRWCNFSGRHRRPPKDPVNALLSYSYAVLAGELEILIRLYNLDPAIGFFHTSAGRASSLVLDLMEVFRPAFCDNLVLSLLNRKIFQPRHFDFDPGSGRVSLTREGRRLFFLHWEKKREHILSDEGELKTWRGIWRDQVSHWVKYLLQKETPHFYRMR